MAPRLDITGRTPAASQPLSPSCHKRVRIAAEDAGTRARRTA
jgi:hypothetical protein